VQGERNGSVVFMTAETLKAELLSSEVWITDMAMNLKCEISYIEEKIETFVTERKINDELAKPLSEHKKHFYNWIKKQKLNGTPRNDRQAAEAAYIERFKSL
jgi:hypothetical protein